MTCVVVPTFNKYAKLITNPCSEIMPNNERASVSLLRWFIFHSRSSDGADTSFTTKSENDYSIDNQLAMNTCKQLH